jgi:hypothetical protein
VWVWFEASFDQRSKHWKKSLRNFQCLEEWRAKVPTIGKTGPESSNHWKKRPKNFQSLEKSALKFPIIGNGHANVRKNRRRAGKGLV